MLAGKEGWSGSWKVSLSENGDTLSLLELLKGNLTLSGKGS